MKITYDWNMSGERLCEIIIGATEPLRVPTGYLDPPPGQYVRAPVYGRLEAGLWEELHLCSVRERFVYLPTAVHEPELDASVREATKKYKHAQAGTEQGISNFPIAFAPGSLLIHYKHFYPGERLRDITVKILYQHFGIESTLLAYYVLDHNRDKIGMVWWQTRSGFTSELFELRLDFDAEFVKDILLTERRKSALNQHLAVPVTPQQMSEIYIDWIVPKGGRDDNRREG